MSDEDPLCLKLRESHFDMYFFPGTHFEQFASDMLAYVLSALNSVGTD